jgi:hypothetical protein
MRTARVSPAAGRAVSGSGLSRSCTLYLSAEPCGSMLTPAGTPTGVCAPLRGASAASASAPSSRLLTGASCAILKCGCFKKGVIEEKLQQERNKLNS